MAADRTRRGPVERLQAWTAGLSRPARYGGAVLVVAATTGVAELLFRFTGDTRLSMVFLAGILIAGVFLGSGPAYLAGLASFLVYNFYLVEPRFTITMQTPEDMLTLIMFTVSAALTSNLSGRIRDHAARERARAATLATLSDATRDFSDSSEESFIRASLLRHLAQAARGMAFLSVDGEIDSAPPGLAAGPGLEHEIRQAETFRAEGPAASSPAVGGWTLRALKVKGERFGVAGWRPAQDPLRASEVELLNLLVDAGATAIARARLSAAKIEAEARARTEDLRNALLASVSHDLRTPLAAIMVSAGSLRRYGASIDEPTREDLALNIEEEAGRLDDFVTGLLSMARLEAGEPAMPQAPFDLRTAAARTLDRRASFRPRLALCAPDDLPKAAGDARLFEQALGNVVDNALRYAADDAAVQVAIRAAAGTLAVEVLDEGPGVPEADLARIFEKFYRAESAGKAPGTGLGLAISQGLLAGMGGSIAAANRDDGRRGLRVTLTLPAAP